MSQDHYKTWIPNSLLNSPAWRATRGVAPHVYLCFYQKRRMAKKQKGVQERKCINERQLEFTYAEALKIGFTEHEFRRAIDTLIQNGFIDIVEYGGGLEHKKTLYGLSERWRAWGQPNFEKAQRVKHRRGYCARELHDPSMYG